MNEIILISDKSKLICVVGLPGAGKTEVSEYIRAKNNFGYFRFGQIVLDKVKEISDKPSEELERKFREEIRAEHGMAAMAILNLPKIEELIETGHVVGDAMRSFEEYLFLKEKFKDRLVVISVYASPALRHQRLLGRAERHGSDVNLKYRSNTAEEVLARDIAEIENLHMGGTIAMADHTLINISTVDDLHSQIDQILEEIFS
jgi:dephospho-CoA kinase